MASARIVRGGVRRTLSAAIALSARARSPALVGGLLGVGVRDLGAGHREGAPRLLILPKGGFIEDVGAAFGGGDFSLLGLARNHTKALYGSFLPRWVDDNSYKSAPASMDARKASLRAFWTKAWPGVQARAKASAVLTGNFAYAAEQEFGAVVEASGTPFIAMHKESLKTPGRELFFKRLYRERRQPFPGRRIVVYNTIERDVQIAAGIAPSENITVCGMPRLDNLHAWRERSTHDSDPRARPMVLMFSFHLKTGLPFIPRKPGGPQGRMETLEHHEEKMTWTALHRGFHQAAVRLARENPGLDVVVKGKADLPKWLKETTGGLLDLEDCPNLRVLLGGDAQGLITRASVVCGFNTTALLEAIAAGKPVVVPRFAEALEDATKPFFLDLGDAVNHAASANDLYDRLLAGAVPLAPPSADLSDHARDMLDHWAGNADGKAGDRVRAAVMAEIGGCS